MNLNNKSRQKKNRHTLSWRSCVNLCAARQFRYSDCEVRCTLTEPTWSTTELLFYQSLPVIAYFLNKSWRKKACRIYDPSFLFLKGSNSHWWHLGKCRGQHTRRAMGEPRPGKTTFVTMVSPLPVSVCSYLLNCLNSYEILCRFLVKAETIKTV